MKYLSAFLFVGMLACGAFAEELHYSKESPSEKQAVKLLNKILMRESLYPLLRGGGVTACETKSGTSFEHFNEIEKETNLFENCIRLYTSSEDLVTELEAQFPPGKRYKGIYVVIMNVGIIRPL